MLGPSIVVQWVKQAYKAGIINTGSSPCCSTSKPVPC